MRTIIVGLIASAALVAGSSSCGNARKNSTEWGKNRVALAGICLTAPQRQIHSTYEIEEISRRVNVDELSPIDFKSFLVFLINVKLQAVKDETSRLLNLHQMVVMNLGASVSEQQKNGLGAAFSQNELPLITEQLLERELMALKAWAPGMSTEEALALADRQHEGKLQAQTPQKPR